MPYAKGDGASLYWEERGSGEPVLLVMGLGATLDLWSRLVPTLSANYRSILFDNRGVGHSDVPDPPYSIPQMARTPSRSSMRRGSVPHTSSARRWAASSPRRSR